MLSATLGKPQLSTRPARRKPKVVTKRLLPVDSAAGAASEIVAPAVFSPIGASNYCSIRGFYSPYFFATGSRPGDGCHSAKIRNSEIACHSRLGLSHRGREAPSSDSTERSHYASLSIFEYRTSRFCWTPSAERPAVVKEMMEGSLSNDDDLTAAGTSSARPIIC